MISMVDGATFAYLHWLKYGSIIATDHWYYLVHDSQSNLAGSLGANGLMISFCTGGIFVKRWHFVSTNPCVGVVASKGPKEEKTKLHFSFAKSFLFATVSFPENECIWAAVPSVLYVGWLRQR